jgi:uncharacterized protein (DUF2236 family)
MTIGKPWAIAIFVALFVSVAANLMIAGFAASRFGGPPRHPDLIERIVAIGIRAFPPAIRSGIQLRSDERREELRVLIDSVEDSRMRMVDAMRANPFDAAALEAAFADMRVRVTDLQAAGQEIVGEAIAAAPADARAQIRLGRGPFP